MKVIFLNTNALANNVYLQNKKLDIVTAKSTAEATISTLERCKNENDFLLIWQRTKKIFNKLFQEFSISRILPARVESYAQRTSQPSVRPQTLVGETTGNSEPTINEIDMARVEVHYNGLDRVISEIREKFDS